MSSKTPANDSCSDSFSSSYFDKWLWKANHNSDKGCSAYVTSCQLCMDTTHNTDHCQLARKVTTIPSYPSSNSSEDGQYSDNEMKQPNDVACVRWKQQSVEISYQQEANSAVVPSTPIKEQRFAPSTHSDGDDFEVKYHNLKMWMRNVLSLDKVREEVFVKNPTLASQIVKFL